MKAIAAANTDEKILKKLYKIGFDLIATQPVESVLEGLRYHPDMQIAVIDKNAVCEPTVYDKYCQFIQSSGFVPIKGKINLTSNYPNDVAYNISVVSNYIFHNSKYTDPEILNNTSQKKIINVSQGYTGCSICRINKDALITADTSIYKAALNCNVDTLLISAGNVRLDGFNYGFIGGATFFCSGTLYTFGKISKHPDYDRIKKFCVNHQTDIFELSDDILTDYGSLITFDNCYK